MRQVTLFLLFQGALAQYFNLNECVIDYRSMEDMWSKKLLDDINKCAEPFKQPPQNGTEPINVEISFTLKSFKLDSDEQDFSVYTRTFFSWQDDRIKWDPQKYDGLDSIVISKLFTIWTPGFRLLNGINDDYDQSYIYDPCRAYSTGEVMCVLWLELMVKCSTDLSDWPFDAQSCKLVIGPYSIVEENINFTIDGRAMTMIGAEYGVEWDIMDYNQKLDGNLTMVFRLERHGDVLAAIIIYPSILLTVLTLSTLLVDVRRSIRLFLLCFSLISHYNFLSELSQEIPAHTEQPPRLLFYYRGSFIMTTILLFFSLAFKVMCSKEWACYNWIISVNEFVFTKFVKLFIWPRWDDSNIISADNFSKDWTDFANILNSVCILISIIVYVSMYCVFVPHPIPIVY